MTALAERSVEEVIADEIRTTRARLEALEFAYGALTGVQAVATPPPALQSLPADEPPPDSPTKRTRRHYSDAEKRQIADRAHELRSCRAAAEEADVPVANVFNWIKAGLSSFEGLPGQTLPPEVADDLRS